MVHKCKLEAVLENENAAFLSVPGTFDDKDTSRLIYSVECIYG